MAENDIEKTQAEHGTNGRKAPALHPQASAGQRRQTRKGNLDRMSHLQRSIELAAFLFRSGEFQKSNDILESLDGLSGEESGESALKRAVATIEDLLGERLFESAAGRGRRLLPGLRTDPIWMAPLLTHYMALCHVESHHPAITALLHALGTEALHTLILFRMARDSGRPIRFRYRSSKQQISCPRRIRVLSLEVRGSRVLAIGREIGQSTVKQYLLQRVESIIGLDERSEEAEGGFAAAEFHADSLLLYSGGERRRALLRFRGEVVPDVEREFFHRTQRLERSGDSITLTLEINNRDELFTLAGRYLGYVEILEPAEWRRDYGRLLLAAAKLHEEATPLADTVSKDGSRGRGSRSHPA